MRDILYVVGAGLVGFGAMSFYQNRQKPEIVVDADDRNEAETFHSEMNEDMSADTGELNRLNPTVVEGA